MQLQPPIFSHHTVTVPTSDTLAYADLACDACGTAPNAGDTIHLFGPLIDMAALFYCDDCYRGFSTSLPAQEAK